MKDVFVFKKTLKLVTAFSVLLAGYAGYVRGFSVVSRWFPPPRTIVVPPVSEGLIQSATAQEATRLALASWGPGHFSVKAPVRYYNSERGYWMFAESAERERDGKRYRLKPFAILWRSKDGRTLKTLTGDDAVADFDQPIDVIKPGARPGHVVHGVINGHVLMRDDRGTPADRSNDLEIGPLTYVEFDEPTLQIRSNSEVYVKDRDTEITGNGLLIELRPHEGPTRTGFNGAKTIWLLRNVNVHSKNVGKSGILPGTVEGGDANAPTPLDLQCLGAMKVALPEPQPPLERGQAPPPPRPTLAWFNRNVRVRRGTDRPDQLDCDELFLTLFPTPKPPAANGAPAPAGSPKSVSAATGEVKAAEAPAAGAGAEGPLTELTLKRAEATGHAVWLQSESQAIKARGNQLIHEKNGPDEPDKTYFQGNANTALLIEKTEYDTDGPDPTKIRFIDTIRSIDVTIFGNAEGGGTSTVLARGPGQLETRAVRTGPVVRSATWQDRCEIRTRGEGEKSRRIITLIGNPKVADAESGTLEAATLIVARLKPNPKTEGPKLPGSETVTSSDTYQVERMEALDDVRLVRGNEVVSADDQLNAEFESVPPREAQPAPSPVAAADAPQPDPDAAPPATPSSDEKKPAEAAPAKPAAQIHAKRVWARILQQSGEKGKGEVEEARLRGAVTIHQDPEPGKEQGTDVSGDAVDLIGQGEGRAKFVIHGRPEQPAEVSSEELKQLQAQEKIVLDQTANVAWVEGPGTLVMMVNKGLLNDGGLVEDRRAEAEPGDEVRRTGGVVDANARASTPPPKVPMTVTWRTRMEFHGQTSDLQGQTVAKAEFFTDVVAQSDDAQITGEDLEAFMDKPVFFTRAPRDPKADKAAEPEPKAQIAFVRCRSPKPSRVVVTNIKRDPETRIILEKQRIEGEFITYDKPTGRFVVLSPGLVRLYGRKGEGANSTLPKPGSSSSRPAEGTASVRVTSRNPGRANVASTAPNRPQTSRQPKNVEAKSKTAVKAVDQPLELTRVQFSKKMIGRFGSGIDTSTAAPRQSDFYGNVEVLHGTVDDLAKDLDPDQPPLDYVFLTSQFLRVVSEPSPQKSKDAARSWLNAVGDANASTRDTHGSASAIQGDQITYDSFKKLFYAYGLDGREVHIAQVAGPGQPASTNSSKSIMYNLETGRLFMEAPKNFLLFDSLKTGSRAPDISPPDPNAKPPKTPRREPRLPPRSDKERRGMMGR